MTTVSVNLHGEQDKPIADILKLDNGERFAVLRFGFSADVILPGRDLDAAAYLRQIAHQCIEAADRLADYASAEYEQKEVVA